MDDLISKKSAIDAADRIIERDKSGNNDVVKAMTAWKEYIAGLSIMDAVPVVRCRNCKYVSKERSPESARKFGQLYDCGLGVLGSPKADDFCSYGKRREE